MPSPELLASTQLITLDQGRSRCEDNNGRTPAKMRNSSAKNHHDVIIIVRPERYSEILSSLRETGNVDQAKRRQLAVEAYTMTSGYDGAIVEYLSSAGITEA